MEIELNTSRIPTNPTEGRKAITRKEQVPAISGADQNPALGELEDKLNRLSVVRPEKIAHARGLVSDETYPPNYLLDRIAVLLAGQIKG